MIIYTCKDPMSFTRAMTDLSSMGIRPRVSRETDLVFRSKPCRKAKEILTRNGFVLYHEPATPPTPEQLEALFNKLGPQP